jgi:hypothetical protein
MKHYFFILLSLTAFNFIQSSAYTPSSSSEQAILLFDSIERVRNRLDKFYNKKEYLSLEQLNRLEKRLTFIYSAQPATCILMRDHYNHWQHKYHPHHLKIQSIFNTLLSARSERKRRREEKI